MRVQMHDMYVCMYACMCMYVCACVRVLACVYMESKPDINVNLASTPEAYYDARAARASGAKLHGLWCHNPKQIQWEGGGCNCICLIQVGASENLPDRRAKL